MPRPRKEPDTRRARQIGVRFTDREIQQLTRAAERAGLPLAGYIRRAALAGRVSVVQSRALDWQAFDQLRRIGVNLNQATRVANAEGLIPPELVTAAAAIEQFLMDEIERRDPEGRR